MTKARIFISFDYDNDEDIKTLLAGQAKHTESPFEFVDGSVKYHLTGDWEEKVKNRMKNCDMAIFLCGTNTHKAEGVAIEVEIAKKMKIPYFFLAGYSDKTCTRPKNCNDEKVYNWTWENLKLLIAGNR